MYISISKICKRTSHLTIQRTKNLRCLVLTHVILHNASFRSNMLLRQLINIYDTCSPHFSLHSNLSLLSSARIAYNMCNICMQIFTVIFHIGPKRMCLGRKSLFIIPSNRCAIPGTSIEGIGISQPLDQRHQECGSPI